jgi:hypothetical protein
VPAYDLCWVYGPWWYPECAPPWFWYPELVAGAGFFFGPAIFMGPLGFWCGFHWHHHQIYVNVNKTFAVHRPSITKMHGGIETWVHNPVHRRGIAYHNQETAQRFGQMMRPGATARRSFRGFTPEGSAAGIGTSPTQRSNRSQTTQSRSMGTNSRQSVQSQRGHAFESFGSSGRGDSA